jgi:hypothetical protein
MPQGALPDRHSNTLKPRLLGVSRDSAEWRASWERCRICGNGCSFSVSAAGCRGSCEAVDGVAR